jgi:gliding motility-associated-like protein
MVIYNRWGEIIWETYDTKGKWDGTFNGSMCPDGSYGWVITFKTPESDEIKQYSGNLIIIR